MSESWRHDVETLRESFDRSCEEFGGHRANVLLVQGPPRPASTDARLGLLDSLNAMSQTNRQPLGLLRLPHADVSDSQDRQCGADEQEHNREVFELYFDSGERASEDRSKRLYDEFTRLCGLVGRLIPMNVQDALRQYVPAYEKPAARTLFLAWLTILEQPCFNADDQGCLSAFVAEPFKGAKALLTTMLANPAGNFVLPDGQLKCGINFRCVNWAGQIYEFTEQQAKCFQVLWEAWQNRTPVVADEDVLKLVGSYSVRLSLVFRAHPAWGTLIIEGQTKGTHRIVCPTEA